MNLKFKILLFWLFAITFCNAQTTLILQPGPSDGNDVLFGSWVPGGDNLTGEITAAQWTSGGSPVEVRSLIRFDLSQIPSNAFVTSATLSLYANYFQSNGNPALGPMYGTDNTSYLYPATMSWDQTTVNWNTQPAYSSSNSTVIPQSTSNYQDYPNLDVTAAVQNMVSNPSTNFGWTLKMATSNYYNSMIFCSSNYQDATKRPKLTITYTTSACTTIQPGPIAGQDIIFGNLPAYLSPDSLAGDLGCIQWTCGGTPCETVSILKFDLATIPPNSIVQSAFLSLYANTQQSNGNIALGPMYGTNNATDLLQITSPWTMPTVNWTNQPSYTTSSMITLPTSTNNYQDYPNIDVSNIVQNWINNPQQNFGWLMKIQTPSYYNSMIFCSSNFADATKRPKLEICLSPTGIADTPRDQIFELYPNPATDFIKIKSVKPTRDKYTITINDELGRIVNELSDLNFDMSGTITIPVQQLKKGLYFVIIRDENGFSKALKFVR